MFRFPLSLIAISMLVVAGCSKAGEESAATLSDSAPPAPAVPATASSDPDQVVPAGGIRAQGWTGRLDPQAAKSGKTLSDASFDLVRDTLQVVSGPAAIYWNPANTARGNYTAAATFIQNKKATHAEGYGLVIAGNNLDKPSQGYLYFLVRQDGKFLINHRASDNEVHKIVDWTANHAVKTPGSDGTTTNALAIEVGEKALSFKVNGKEVRSIPRSTIDAGGPHSGTAGTVGLRINHNLNVSVHGFAVRTRS